MRNLLIGLSLCAVAGCTDPAQQAYTQQTVAVLCAQDAILQPLASAVVAVADPAVAPAVTAESLLVHPAVVAACAKQGSVPVGVVLPPPVGAAPALVPAVAAPIPMH